MRTLFFIFTIILLTGKPSWPSCVSSSASLKISFHEYNERKLSVRICEGNNCRELKDDTGWLGGHLALVQLIRSQKLAGAKNINIDGQELRGFKIFLASRLDFFRSKIAPPSGTGTFKTKEEIVAKLLGEPAPVYKGPNYAKSAAKLDALMKALQRKQISLKELTLLSTNIEKAMREEDLFVTASVRRNFTSEYPKAEQQLSDLGLPSIVPYIAIDDCSNKTIGSFNFRTQQPAPKKTGSAPATIDD